MLESVIAQIDAQIANLQQAKVLLSGGVSIGAAKPGAKRPGSPAGSKSKSAAPTKRRKTSAVGRKAIAEAQRQRWAKIKADKAK
jgi:hypothetical protein